MKASLFWAVFTVVVSCISLTKSSAGLQPSFMLVIWQLGLLLHRLGVKFGFAALTANTARQGGSHTAQHNSHPSKCNSVSEDEAKNVATIQHDLAGIKTYSSKKCRHKFLPGFRILPKGWAANLGLRSGAEKPQLFYISSLQKKTQSLRPPDTQVFTSLAFLPRSLLVELRALVIVTTHVTNGIHKWPTGAHGSQEGDS